MTGITFEEVTRVEECRSLCDELMAYQKSKAKIHAEWFDLMDFDTRMKKSCENALRSRIIAAKDEDAPIGYVFSTIDEISAADRNAYPDWAQKIGMGFYPDWLALPQRIGCLNNLYLSGQYRGLGLGSKLFDMAIKWLESFSDADVCFVYISNGNDAALRFYLERGFVFSHDVFGGFIQAAYKKK